MYCRYPYLAQLFRRRLRETINYGLPAKILTNVRRQWGGVQEKAKSGERLFKPSAALPLIFRRWRRTNIPVPPAKRYGDTFVLESAARRIIIFPVVLHYFFGTAERIDLKVKRRLNCIDNQSSEERIVIVTLFRTLAFNGLLSVFVAVCPGSIGSASALKRLGLR